MIINKPVKEIKTDGQCTVIEFQDNTLLPLYNIPIKFVDAKCIFCHSNNLCVSLDNITYICADCLSRLLETALNNHMDLDVNLANINNRLANTLLSKINELTREFKEEKG